MVSKRIHHMLPLLLVAALLIALAPSGNVAAQSEVAERFQAYYNQIEGIRVFGAPLTAETEVNGIPSQYFEKARLEDHRASVPSGEWAFMYGRLTDELMTRDPNGAVSGTNVTYGGLLFAHQADRREPAPQSFTGGTMTVRQGQFIPYDSQLRPASGYVVPLYFWSYMNRGNLFPTGWLHTFGLPMTDAFQARATKADQQRDVIIQAFERAVLTYDPQNPTGWQVERGNIGADALRTLDLPPPMAGAVTIPAANGLVTLPLHVLARVGEPGRRVTAELRWQDGTILTRELDVLRGEDGAGLVISSLEFPQTVPPMPASQPATLTLRDSGGALLATQTVMVLSRDAPNTQLVSVAFLLGEDIALAQRRIPATPTIGVAALEELLWGPLPDNPAGFTTAIPTPQEVLNFPGRGPDWGPRVTLRGLTIENGVATADFSQELRAYGGGSARVQQIREQITRTLQQFPTVREVRIAIEGETEGVLEP